MKRFAVAATFALATVLAGCGGSEPAAGSSATGESATASEAAASGCTAGGLDAMTALSDFQLELDKAQKDGTITLDQLLAARDTLFNTTQEAQAKGDWTAYCQAIEDTRKELGL